MPPDDTGEIRRFYVPNSPTTVSLSSGTNEDEPEGAGVSQPLPPRENPATAGVRAYKANAVAILGLIYGQAWACLQNDAMPQEKVVGLAVEVGKFGMRAKRALLRAAEEVR